MTGLDVFLSDLSHVQGRNIGLLVNHTSVDSNLIHIWNLFKKNNITVKRIFSPEHGLFATEQDQVPVRNQPDPGIPVVSLYGTSEQTLVPDREMFRDLDLVIFDIQDVGSRYYTYLNTMIYFMQELSGTRISFMVLDRPNPLGGLRVEGPLLLPGYRSFVGVLPVPVRHGLTAGETALFARDYFKLDLDLSVVRMSGWTRDMYYDSTGLPWVAPSPNMPALSTALVYPGMCLLEGTTLSEGRGTTTPFELSGAPWIDAFKLAGKLNGTTCSGAVFRPHYFIPVTSKHRGSVCGGVHIHVKDRDGFCPFYTAVELIFHVLSLCNEFEFSEGVYEYRSNIPAFDLLAGSDSIRSMLTQGAFPGDIRACWIDGEKEYVELKKNYHLY